MNVTGGYIETVQEDQLHDSGGNWIAEGFTLAIPATVGDHMLNISFPMPVDLWRSNFMDLVDCLGDKVGFCVGEGMPIGLVTVAGAIDDIIINVTTTVIDNMKVGYIAGVNSQDLGRVLEVNKTNSTITVENALTAAIAVNDVITQSILFAKDIYFNGTNQIVYLNGGVGTSGVPANVEVTLVYSNITGTAKTFNFILEYFY